ncbi:MAG: undecaprenyl-diphosphate phosphatase [Hyphomicrobiales bacterium]|nr:undecaprenyl-diphosphate phosphatase [Hyphomicrobiales bacterium]MDE2018288.1 undecaprenyl-diphosphate phosphatase [Hyphomicrobiales bacterium]
MTFTFLQAVVMALLQGVTELFPVSSLGHAVVLPKLLGWKIDERAPDFLPYLVVMHLGTATALLIYFWREWIGFLQAFLSPSGEDASARRRLFLLVCVGTVPAVLLALVFRKLLGDAFGTPVLAAAMLIVNGFLLFFGEKLRRADDGASLDRLNWRGAAAIGVTQAFALIPGISRSGATIVGGILVGLHHREAARFAFLLATPIIFAAGVHEAPKLLHSGATLGPAALVSGVVAGVVAYASTAFLMRYFKDHEFEALNPFAYYCIAAGALSLGLLYVL